MTRFANDGHVPAAQNGDHTGGEVEKFDWQDAIVTAVFIRQHMMDADKTPLWKYDFPRVAATKAMIQGAERSLGLTLDDQYRQFLLFADGWEHFDGDVNLFGTPELQGGGSRSAAEEYLTSAEETGVLARLGLTRGDVLPIAACEEQMDLYLLVRPEHVRAGQVMWIAGEPVDEYQSFEEYFLAMLDYMRYRLQKLQDDRI